MKLKKYFTVLPFSVQALNLSTDLNSLSAHNLDKYLDEASQILDFYPVESFAKVKADSEIMERKRRKKRGVSRVKLGFFIWVLLNFGYFCFFFLFETL